ncbi:hypothetical protein DFJ74DRAFT_678729 [Hyaloraphidium curvatum]|nr:hypothetical protein DFJ74DRAFT_678729 [Hyaloraphidium curvatum]
MRLSRLFAFGQRNRAQKTAWSALDPGRTANGDGPGPAARGRRDLAPDILAALALLSVCLALHWAAITLLCHSAYSSGTRAARNVVVSAGLAVAFAPVRADAMPPALRLLLGIVGTGLWVHVLFDAFGAVPPGPNLVFDGPLPKQVFRYGAAVAVASGAVAWRRPSFWLPVAVYYFNFRVRLNIETGTFISDIDFRGAQDAVVFGSIAAPVIIVLTSERVCRWVGSVLAAKHVSVSSDGERVRTLALELVWAVMVGAHLGNYYRSGIGKLLIGWSWDRFLWLKKNTTHFSVLVGLERQSNPLLVVPPLAGLAYHAIRILAPFLNFSVLAGQLAGCIAFLDMRLLRALAIFYDLFHLVIWFTLGALFHLWIVVNVAVFISSRRIAPTWPSKLVGTLACTVNTPFFTQQKLAWLDGPQTVTPTFRAVTASGESHLVPPAFFGMHSYRVAHGGMYVPAGHYPANYGGAFWDPADWYRALACANSTRGEQRNGHSMGLVVRLLQLAHGFAERHPAAKRWNLYFAYPHHMPPVPLLHRGFGGLRMDEVVRYEYVVESACLGFERGRLTRRVASRNVAEIEVVRKEGRSELRLVKSGNMQKPIGA